MDQPSLAQESHVLLLLASHMGAGQETDKRKSGLGPAGWQDFAAAVQRSQLASPGELLDLDPEEWPTEIATGEASLDWIEERLTRSAKLAMKLEDLNSRGVWVTTLYEPTYPDRLLHALGRKAPPFLYVAGSADHLQGSAVGFVGSRDVDEDDKEATRHLVRKVTQDGFGIVSGGAKGIDRTSEQAGLRHGGPVIEFPTEGLRRCLKDKPTRDAVRDGRLTLASHYHPQAAWNVGAAMGRNKLIHGFASYTIVIRSGHETGGTWSGATENLAHGWSPLLVWAPEEVPDGNRALIEEGGVPVGPEILDADRSFQAWLRDQRNRTAHGGPIAEEGQARSSGDPISEAADQASLEDF